MIKEPVVDNKNAVNSNIFSLCESGGKLKKRPCQAKKILDLSPLLLAQFQFRTVAVRREFIKHRL
jgi:hypothetical protein